MRKTRLLRGLRLVVLCGIQLRGFCCCFKTSCGTPGWLWAHSVLISFPALGSCCCEWTPTKVKARQGSIAASILYGWLLLAAWQGQGWLSGFGLWQSDQKVGAILGLFLYEGEDLPESQSNFHFCSVVQSYWHCQLIVLCSFFGEKLDHNCFFPKGTLDFFFFTDKMQWFENSLLMAVVFLIMKSEMGILSVCQLRSDLYKQGQAFRDWVTRRRRSDSFLTPASSWHLCY